MYLDNEGSYTASNPVDRYSGGAGNTNQQWQINELSNGKYNLINLSSGMALDNGGSTANGAKILQNPSSITNTNQQWTITSLGSGEYQFVVASSGKALDNSGATANGGTVFQQPVASGDADQEWQLFPVQIGADTPFTTYEAESGTLGGGATVVSLTSPATTEFTTPQLEASGHAYVHLSGTGQSVTWTNNTGEDITLVNVRYSIPDSSGGGGISSTLDLYVDGTFRQAIPVNSIQTWLYESSSAYDAQNQSPSGGNAYVFWDEVPVTISGAAITPSQTIELKQDFSNSAEYYKIDLDDLENPPAPYAQPAYSISITRCGAVANTRTIDNTSAIQTCINDGQSQGKVVWIPEGKFYLTKMQGLTATNVTIEGAGMWYSILYYNPPLPATVTSHGVILATSTTLENFAIDGNGRSKTYEDGTTIGINQKGSNWTINGIWLRHEGPSIWADGININNGNGTSGNNSGSNITVRNNFVRGTGDDGFALNDANNGSGYVQMQNLTFLNNTAVTPWWGNNFGIYGGQTSLIANNLSYTSVR